MLKANNLLQYMNGVGKKMEINTTEILYKVLVRSMFDYGSMIYFLKTKIKRTRLKKTQYQGQRTILGYRISILTNIILEETKITNLKERAINLAKKLAKVILWRKDSLKKKTRKTEYEVTKAAMKYPKRRISIISKAWRRVRKDGGKVKKSEGYVVAKDKRQD